MTPVDRVKIALHRDLASDPETHGWVLNLYRAGEQHPERVGDYFPHMHAPCPELAKQLRRHAGDERRHTVLYGKVIEAMGQPLLELGGEDVFNEVIRSRTPLSFAIREEDSPDRKRLRVAHFLAHAHFLERRVQRSLDYHLEACAQLGKREVGSVVSAIHADEARHVRSTREACEALLTRAELATVLTIHAEAEELANRAFSAHQMRRLLRLYGARFSKTHRAIYRLSLLLLEHAPTRADAN